MPYKLVLASLFNSLRGAPRLADGNLQVRRQSRGRVAAATLSSALGLIFGLVVAPDGHAKSLHPDFQLMRGEVQQYGDWLVGCDNQASCTMLGFPSWLPGRERDPLTTEMAIQIGLSGPSDAAPVVEIVPFGLNVGRSGFGTLSRPFFLNVEYQVAALSPPHGFLRQALLPMEAEAVLSHLGSDQPILGKTLSEPRQSIRFPQLGFNRAYRVMQERRTALLKLVADNALEDVSGKLPDDTAIRIPHPQWRIPAKPHIVSGSLPLLTDNQCKASRTHDMQHFVFDNGALLWSYSCNDGSASWQSRTYWEMAPAGPKMLAEPLSLAEPRDRKVDAGSKGLENAVFDWDFGILRAYNYLDGREDCGTFRAWGYTDSGWQLIERREMPLCKGLARNEWIRTHFQPTDGPGPDE